jgi:Mrp family chromosome partitioning ATPase/NifU-like protein involved in Fe-S cluster formation/predicted Fe-Mo cluster-binding NifX family protein
MGCPIPARPDPAAEKAGAGRVNGLLQWLEPIRRRYQFDMAANDLEKLTPTARDHAEHPRHHGPSVDFNGHARVTGPCGDTMEFWLNVQDGKVAGISFTTDGCGPSQACGSMAACLAEGKKVRAVSRLGQWDIIKALGGLPGEFAHCALLAADTLGAACRDYLERGKSAREAGSRVGKKADGAGCGLGCASAQRLPDESEQEYLDRCHLQSRLRRVRRKVLVLSGKGGVGKSTMAVNLAVALQLAGKKVGLLDVDIHGPSIPTMLGLEGSRILGEEEGLRPVDAGGLKVVSLGFFLTEPDAAVIWRGPMKMKVIQQFLKDVSWGDLDFLIIDSPPGTGDEPLSVCQLIGGLDGAVIVTTPQQVAAVDVRRSITFCRDLQVPVLGVVENMSGFACPKCGEVTPILRSGGGRRLAGEMGVPFLGSIPMDPAIAEACDDGQAFIRHHADSRTAGIMRDIIRPILAMETAEVPDLASNTEQTKEDHPMRIALPLADGKLAMHFGHCERFAVIDVDPASGRTLRREDLEAPPHQPGLLPPWLAERGVNLIIAGGMGQRAQDLFGQHGIQVLVGAPAGTPAKLVADYLAGKLQPGENVCDH